MAGIGADQCSVYGKLWDLPTSMVWVASKLLQYQLFQASGDLISGA